MRKVVEIRRLLDPLDVLKRLLNDFIFTTVTVYGKQDCCFSIFYITEKIRSYINVVHLVSLRGFLPAG